MFRALRGVGSVVFFLTAAGSLVLIGFFLWLGILAVYPIARKFGLFRRKKNE